MKAKLTLIYWKSDKFWLGKLLEHPEIMTQGETLDELEENIKDAYLLMALADVCVLLRYGSRHDIYLNPATGKKQSVPRHAEIDDRLAKHMRKYFGLAAES